jgi:putative ABC transport system permease protein
MIKSYLKPAWRTLVKNKMFALIIISGLTFGYAACIMILITDNPGEDGVAA